MNNFNQFENHAEDADRTVLITVRVPEQMRVDFNILCARKRTTPTSVLREFIAQQLQMTKEEGGKSPPLRAADSNRIG